MQRGDGRGGGVPRRVGHRDHRRGAAVDRDEHRGAAGRGQLVPPCRQHAEVDVFVGHQFPVAHDDPVTVHRGGGAVPGDVPEIVGGQPVRAVLLRVPDDGPGQRVLGFAFHRGGQRQQFLLTESCGVVDDHVGDLGFALGQGAGLVHHHGVDPGRGLQRGGVLEQHPAFRAEPGADHDRRRRRQPQRVGAGDHHDGDREQQRGLHARTGRQPDREGEAAADQRDQHQPERRPVGQPLPGCLGVLRLLHQRHDLRQRGVRADLGGPHPQRAGDVHRRPDHLRPGALDHRQALAGDHRLVDLGIAALDQAVDRDLRPGPDQQQITDLDVRGGDLVSPARRGAPRPSGARVPAGCGWRRWRRRGRASRTNARAARTR